MKEYITMITNQQKGFMVDEFEYCEFPAMRFIGLACEGVANDANKRHEIFAKSLATLDAMQEYKSGFDYDIMLAHHCGLSADNPWLGVCGRFMKVDTPVPEGFRAIDFAPDASHKAGPPYYSHFAFAKFTGDTKAMHSQEGFDCYGICDVTRNIIIGDGIGIPYPEKYWYAEVFLDGYENESTGYLWGVKKDKDTPFPARRDARNFDKPDQQK